MSDAPTPPPNPPSPPASPPPSDGEQPKKKKKKRKPGVRLVGLPGGPVLLTAQQVAQLGIRPKPDALWLRIVLGVLLMGAVGLSFLAFKVWVLDPPKDFKTLEWASAFRSHAHDFEVRYQALSVEPLLLRGLDPEPSVPPAELENLRQSLSAIQDEMRAAHKSFQTAMKIGLEFLNAHSPENEDYAAVQADMTQLRKRYIQFLGMARTVEALDKRLRGERPATADNASTPK